MNDTQQKTKSLADMIREQAGTYLIDISKESKATRKIYGGIIIAEYGVRELQDHAKQELKRRVNVAMKACKDVQQWLIEHPKCQPESKKKLTADFNGNEVMLLSELYDTVIGLNEADLEMILDSIKQNIDEKKGNDTTEQN